MICTRCQSSGFLNITQVDELTLKQFDVQVCDCCGDGEYWYGTAGHHWQGEPDDTYKYNGGLPECN